MNESNTDCGHGNASRYPAEHYHWTPKSNL